MSEPANLDLNTRLDRLLLKTNGGSNLDPVYEELGKGELNFDADIQELIQAGQVWWRRHEAKLRSMVCNQPPIRSIVDGKLKDVALAVAEIVADQLGLGKAATVGLIVARLGLSEWCRVEWNKIP